MKNHVVVSFYAPKGYLHVYGPYERDKAKKVKQELENDVIQALGEDRFRQTTKVWVKKLIDTEKEV